MNPPRDHQERHSAAARLKAAQEAVQIAEARAKFWDRWYQGAYYTAINGTDEDREDCERELIAMQEAARVNDSDAADEDAEMIARIIANDSQGAKYEFH